MNEIPVGQLDESQRNPDSVSLRSVGIQAASKLSQKSCYRVTGPGAFFSPSTQYLSVTTPISLNLHASPLIVLYLECDSSAFLGQDIYRKIRRCLSASLPPCGNFSFSTKMPQQFLS